jgi:hypothetical protein
MRIIACAVALASTVFAQSPEPRTFTFAHIESPRSIQEFVNTVRSIGETQNVSVDAAARTLRVAGTPDQLALTQWFLDSLDQASSPSAFTVRETTFPAPRNESVVKALYLPHLANPVDFQETVNCIRSLAEAQRVVVFLDSRAIVLRATADSAAFGEWLAREIDAAAVRRPEGAVRQYRYADPDLIPERFRRPAVRVFYPKSMGTPLQLQEAINALRSILEIQRVIAITSSWAILVRGTDPQAEAAEWLIRQLDAGAESQSLAIENDVVQTLFAPKGRTPRQLAGLVNEIRQSTGLQRVVMYQGRSAVVVRGTPEQVRNAVSLMR